MSSLDDFKPPVHVELPFNVTQKQLPTLQGMNRHITHQSETAAIDPNHVLHSDPYVLRKIEIQSVNWFGASRVGFVKLHASMQDSKGRVLPGIAFLCSGYVAVLMILRPQDSRDERWVLMVQQSRVPTGSLSFVEIPTDIFSETEEFSGQSSMKIRFQATHERLDKSH
jgi:ADP-sugar diphosphatase